MSEQDAAHFRLEVAYQRVKNSAEYHRQRALAIAAGEADDLVGADGDSSSFEEEEPPVGEDQDHCAEGNASTATAGSRGTRVLIKADTGTASRELYQC